MPSERPILRLVADAYDAAVEPRRWPAFLEHLAEVMDGVGAVLWLRQPGLPGGCAFTARRDPDYQARYHAHYAARDVWARETIALAAGTPFICADLVPRHRLERTEFWADWLRPQGLAQGCGVAFGRIDAMVGMLRPAGARTFSSGDLALYRALAPHLARAVVIQRRLGRLEGEHAAAASVLDRLPLGVIFVDAHGRVRRANRSGEEILTSADGLTADRHGLRAGSPASTAQLRALVERSARGELDAGGALLLERPSGGEPLSVLVTPAPAVDWPGTDAAAAVVFVGGASRVETPERLLRRLYGLTPAEARLAAAIAEGRGIDDAAERLGVSRHTARAQLAQVFAKTGANRQAALVRLLLSGPAGLRA